MNQWASSCLAPVLLATAAPQSGHIAISSYTSVPFASDGVNLFYPVFSLDDSAVETAINDRIAANIRHLLADWTRRPAGSKADGGVLRVAVDEEQNVLSLLMNVTFDIPGAVHPHSLMYAENYSLDDGSPIRPIDFLDIDRLIGRIQAQAIFCPEGCAARSFAEQTDYLASLPDHALESHLLEGSIMWLPGDSILIVLPVPHALGGFALLLADKFALS